MAPAGVKGLNGHGDGALACRLSSGPFSNVSRLLSVPRDGPVSPWPGAGPRRSRLTQDLSQLLSLYSGSGIRAVVPFITDVLG